VTAPALHGHGSPGRRGSEPQVGATVKSTVALYATVDFEVNSEELCHSSSENSCDSHISPSTPQLSTHATMVMLPFVLHASEMHSEQSLTVLHASTLKAACAQSEEKSAAHHLKRRGGEGEEQRRRLQARRTSRDHGLPAWLALHGCRPGPASSEGMHV
jgi:hypothetical protein